MIQSSGTPIALRNKKNLGRFKIRPNQESQTRDRTLTTVFGAYEFYGKAHLNFNSQT
jgi:hypothetical protein